jgi:hypothetical protein
MDATKVDGTDKAHVINNVFRRVHDGAITGRGLDQSPRAFIQNLVVRNDWVEDFRNRGPDSGDTMSTFVAYSIVPTYGVNSLIADNYAIAGERPIWRPLVRGESAANGRFIS